MARVQGGDLTAPAPRAGVVVIPLHAQGGRIG
jgi:hypothetical protein